LQPEWIDLNQDLNKLVESYAQEAVKKDIALQFFPASEEMLLFADSDVLHRIMDNLINNAVKFSPVGKNIIVKLRRQGNDALIYLKDEGPGFSLEDRKGIFKKFARLSARPTSQESSTGLGLAIVKRMVTQLGGEIRLLDEKEAGAVFEVRIPLEQGLVEA
jgi:signal transduction histidine kinase